MALGGALRNSMQTCPFAGSEAEVQHAITNANGRVGGVHALCHPLARGTLAVDSEKKIIVIYASPIQRRHAHGVLPRK